MTYAIDTLLRLCEENTRLRLEAKRYCYKDADIDRLNEDPIQLEIREKKTEDEYWAALQHIPTPIIKQYLAEECSLHIYDLPPPTAAEVERLKESADLIAESQQKQIDQLLDDKRERMEDREKLLKDIKSYQTQLAQLADVLLETKVQLKHAQEQRGVGRPKKTECSPCIADPSP
jgi:septal ring factor EnvC (AmiA/AmiB activator)